MATQLSPDQFRDAMTDLLDGLVSIAEQLPATGPDAALQACAQAFDAFMQAAGGQLPQPDQGDQAQPTQMARKARREISSSARADRMNQSRVYTGRDVFAEGGGTSRVDGHGMWPADMSQQLELKRRDALARQPATGVQKSRRPEPLWPADMSQQLDDKRKRERRGAR
jgi:hypothetical protein